MPAKDLGTKYACFKCATKFYDMRKPAPICPKCGADQRESPALKPAPEKRRAAPKAAVVEPTAVAEEVEADGLEEDADEADDAEEEAVEEEDEP